MQKNPYLEWAKTKLILIPWTITHMFLTVIGGNIHWALSQISAFNNFDDVLGIFTRLVWQLLAFWAFILFFKKSQLGTRWFLITMAVVLNICFITALTFNENNQLIFFSSWDTFTFQVLRILGPFMTGSIVFIKPIVGSFDDGLIQIEDTGYVYIFWVLAPIAYYVLIDWFAKRFIKRQPDV